MAEEEPGQVSAAAAAPFDPIVLLRDAAPWLFAAELGTCLVGSQALAHACRVAGIDGPRPMDIDIAWGLDLAAGQALLQQHGVFVPTTTGNQERGTLAMKVAGRRLEVTTFRAGAASAPLRDRILADLGERDMTIGAVAVELRHRPHPRSAPRPAALATAPHRAGRRGRAARARAPDPLAALLPQGARVRVPARTCGAVARTRNRRCCTRCRARRSRSNCARCC